MLLKRLQLAKVLRPKYGASKANFKIYSHLPNGLPDVLNLSAAKAPLPKWMSKGTHSVAGQSSPPSIRKVRSPHAAAVLRGFTKTQAHTSPGKVSLVTDRSTSTTRKDPYGSL